MKDAIKEYVDNSTAVEFKTPQGKAAFIRGLLKIIDSKPVQDKETTSTRRSDKNVVHPMKNRKKGGSGSTVMTERMSSAGDRILERKIARNNKEVKEW